MSSEDSYIAVLKASYDYQPEPDSEEELAIKEDQLLFLLERTDDDWWRVKLKTETQDEDGKSGLVPSAYVEPATHTSVVKALYDYEATQPSELSVKEDEVLYVFDKDEDWLLVQSKGDDSKAGYVPANYVEEASDSDDQHVSAAPAISAPSIVIPPSPPRPEYIDPADRVASSKKTQVQDDIKTWSVSEVDKKGKKKKGTLGVGNGAIFFASESDKTPVQKWQMVDVSNSWIDKSKHVHIDIGGTSAANLHFNAGSKDVAEAILTKLDSSKALVKPEATSSSADGDEIERPRSAHKAVRITDAEPEIIPAAEEPDDVEDEEPEPAYHHEEHLPEVEGDRAVVLYDFSADGEDELTVAEGDTLLVLERDGDEWWKCKNQHGVEGVVPASYVELVGGASSSSSSSAKDIAAAKLAEEVAEREEEEAAEREREEQERKEQEQAEKERKKAEAEKRAKAAAAAAEADRRRREQEREKQKQKEREAAAAAAADEEAKKKKQAQRESTSEPSRSRDKKANGDSRASTDSKRSPPTGNVRTWHDRTGQFKVEAAYLGFANGKLRLHKVNGVVIEVPSEKMSPEDLRYVEKFTSKSSASSPPPRKSDDDDEPLSKRRESLLPAASSSRSAGPKKGPTVDWFEFFLNAGCDVDDCTRYARSFENDKIDEAILPDITESTMRSLGLREGDIIRVKKAIESKIPTKPDSSSSTREQQVRADEELARQLQAEENNGKRGQAPNLFAGPNGELKNNSVRRGRPQPSKTLPPTSVDINSISSASDQIRTSTPQAMSPSSARSSTPVQVPARSSSAVPSGFDDDAWTNRPSSTKPLTPTPAPVVQPAPAAPRAPSAPPAAPIPPASPPKAVAPPTAAPLTQSQSSPPPTSLAKTTESDIFDQLARLSQIRVASPVAPPKPAISPAILTPPASFQSGLGMGSSPVPIGQHLQAQQTGFFNPNGPRGPFAPVPANQSLLQPLVPTTTGFNSFIPTRPQSTPSFQAPHIPTTFASPPPQPSFLSTQPTGFMGASQPLLSQPTGYISSGPLLSQPTGIGGNFGSGFGGNISPAPPLPMNTGFGGIQPNPTGFNPGYGQSPFSNNLPPPIPQAPTNDTSPDNVFAQMKSGTFASDSPGGPQGADKYNALRGNSLSPLNAQPTGWGFQGMNGMPGGYGYQQ